MIVVALLSCLIQDPLDQGVGALLAEAMQANRDGSSMLRIEGALVRRKATAAQAVAAVLPDAIRTGRGVLTLLRALERMGPEAVPCAETVRSNLAVFTDAELVCAARIAANTVSFLPIDTGSALSSCLMTEWTDRLTKRMQEIPRLEKIQVDMALARCDEAANLHIRQSGEKLAAKLARNVPGTRVLAAQAIARKPGVPDDERCRLLFRALEQASEALRGQWLQQGMPTDDFEVAVAADVVDLRLAERNPPLLRAALRILGKSHRDPVVRGTSVKALAQLRGQESRELLAVAAQDRDPIVVRAVIEAVVALGEGGKPMRWILFGLLEHDETTVREAALEALTDR